MGKVQLLTEAVMHASPPYWDYSHRRKSGSAMNREAQPESSESGVPRITVEPGIGREMG